MKKLYYVYIMANRHRSVLYTGVSGAIVPRVIQHKTKAIEGFTSRYHVDRLVYYEETDDIGAAIHREKQIKGWRRAKKIALVESLNPLWFDLAEMWVPRDGVSDAAAPASGFLREVACWSQPGAVPLRMTAVVRCQL